MPTDQQQSSQADAARASLELAFKVLAQIALLTLLVVIGALFAGMWLDRVLATRRLFTVLLLLVSFPLSLYIIFRVAMNAVAQIKPVRRQSPAVKEDQHRDDDPAAT